MVFYVSHFRWLSEVEPKLVAATFFHPTFFTITFVNWLFTLSTSIGLSKGKNQNEKYESRFHSEHLYDSKTENENAVRGRENLIQTCHICLTRLTLYKAVSMFNKTNFIQSII